MESALIGTRAHVMMDGLELSVTQSSRENLVHSLAPMWINYDVHTLFNVPQIGERVVIVKLE